MPVTNGVGHSLATPDKEEGFSAYLSLHMRICESVFKRNPWIPRNYFYIDTHAGSGANPEESVQGSPAIFAEHALQYGPKWTAHMIEIEAANVLYLRERLPVHSSLHIHHENNRSAIPRILADMPRESYGLVYMDPNGEPDWELLSQIADQQKRLDLFIRCPTRAIKRKRYQGAQYLVDSMKALQKERWLIRDTIPGDRFDWTFLFGTNYTNARDWRSMRFYDCKSSHGSAILQRLNFTQKEIYDLNQLQLFTEQAVKERSAGVCELCKQAIATEIHHCKGGYGSSDPSKRIAVCHECHCKVEGVAS